MEKSDLTIFLEIPLSFLREKKFETILEAIKLSSPHIGHPIEILAAGDVYRVGGEIMDYKELAYKIEERVKDSTYTTVYFMRLKLDDLVGHSNLIEFVQRTAVLSYKQGCAGAVHLAIIAKDVLR